MALGAASPYAVIALLGCVLVAFSSAEPWTYYQRYNLTTCHAGNYFAPSTIAEVQQIVINARAAGRNVRALGSLHSISSIICVENGGDVVWLGNMKAVKEVNVAQGYAIVEAGIAVSELQLALAQEGGALEHTPQYGAITIGGALATGAHGSTYTKGAALADQVLGLTFVNGKGEIISIDTPAALNVARVHMGLLGVVVEAKMKIEPIFKVHAEKVVYPEEIVLNGSVIDMARQYDFFTVNWFPWLGHAVVFRYNKVPASTEGNDYWGLFSRTDVPTIFQGIEVAAATRDVDLHCAMAELEFDWYANGAVFKEIGTDEVKNPAVGYPYQILSSLGPGPCVGPQCESSPFASIFDASYAVPEEEFVDAANFINDLVSHQQYCFVYNGGIFLRFLKGTSNLMSTHYGEDHIMFEYVPNQRVDPTEPRLRLDVQQEINQALMYKYKAKPHWGKNGDASFYLTSLKYPQSLAFKAFRSYMDPDNVFDHHFARIVFQGEPVDQSPGCALYDRCFCNLIPAAQSCAPSQFCGLGYDFPLSAVCKDKFPPGASCLVDAQCATDRCFFFKCRE